MESKTQKHTNTIDGNYLSVEIFKKLFKYFDELGISKNNTDKLEMVIQKHSQFDNRVEVIIKYGNKQCLFMKKVNDDQWARNTIWCWVTGYYMLDLLEREVKRNEINKVIDSTTSSGLKVEINYKLIFELFENVSIDQFTSFNISEFLSKQTLVKDSFSYKVKREIISSDKHSIIYHLFNRYPFLEKKDTLMKCSDPRMQNFLNTLIDGITGEISKKEPIRKIVESISNEINNYQNYVDEVRTLSDNNSYKIKKINDELEIIKELLKYKLRSNFRRNLINYRKESKNYLRHDLSNSKLNNDDNLDWYVDAVHIVPMNDIVENLFNRYKDNKNFQNIILYDEDVIKYSNPKNGLLIPFNYHRFYKKRYFHFDKNGEIKIAKDKEDNSLFLEFGINSNGKIKYIIR